jgi:predicted RNA-binding protein with EMAP domain
MNQLKGRKAEAREKQIERILQDLKSDYLIENDLEDQLKSLKDASKECRELAKAVNELFLEWKNYALRLKAVCVTEMGKLRVPITS